MGRQRDPATLKRHLYCDSPKLFGELIVYKKAIVQYRVSERQRRRHKRVWGDLGPEWKDRGGKAIVTMRIPVDAYRSGSRHGKCRASKAVVLAITRPSGHELRPSKNLRVVSLYDPGVEYRVGKTMRPRWGGFERSSATCAPGIHFFLSRSAAKGYCL